MPSPRGCFKTGCFGCLGASALLLLIVGITALLAWNDVKKSDPTSEVLTPLKADSSVMLAGHPGRVVLDMAQGEFQIQSAEPGEGLRVEAVYDGELYDLQQHYSTLPDSSWQFKLDFKRTGSGMRAFMQSMFSQGPSTKIHVFLPPDVPVELLARVSKGGLEGDLGGLWLTSADVSMRQGGGMIEFSEPTKEPMSNLRIRFAMGGGSIEDVGNASPAILDISSSMGGAEVDLGGAWVNDCDVNLSAKMGGMAVIIPKSIKVDNLSNKASMGTNANAETPGPVLWLNTRAKYGEVEIVH